jgi:lipid-binding SYLF domain-containing protein
MRKSLSLLIAVTTVCVFFTPPLLQAGSKQVAKVKAATKVLKQIIAVPGQSIPPSLLRNAQGVAVIPGVIKAGFIIGGRGGRGILVLRKKENCWSNPSFVTLAGGSIGCQIGAQSADVILVFKSRKGVDGIVKGKFTLGADAAVAAGPVGRQAEAATDIQLKAEIYSYSRSRGLFAGISLEGAALLSYFCYRKGSSHHFTQDLVDS